MMVDCVSQHVAKVVAGALSEAVAGIEMRTMRAEERGKGMVDDNGEELVARERDAAFVNTKIKS
jgi:hypothetical protein